MLENFLIVNKEILPDYYEKVVEARNMINEGRVKGISEAVKQVGISRSTYYKYKDYIFAPGENTSGRKGNFIRSAESVVKHECKYFDDYSESANQSQGKCRIIFRYLGYRCID